MLDLLAVAVLLVLFIGVGMSALSPRDILGKSGAYGIAAGICAVLDGILKRVIAAYSLTVPSFLQRVAEVSPPGSLEMGIFLFSILVGFIFIKSSKLAKKQLLLWGVALLHLLLTLVLMAVSRSTASAMLLISSVLYIIGLAKQYRASRL